MHDTILFMTDSVGVFLNVGIAIAVHVAIGIGGVVGVQAMGFFPLVGHTVSICIDVWLPRFVLRISHLFVVGCLFCPYIGAPAIDDNHQETDQG